MSSIAVSINLLPEKSRRGELIMRYAVLGTVSVVAVVALFFSMGLSRQGELARVQGEIATVQAKLESEELKRVVAEVRSFTAAQGALKLQAEKLDRLREQQVTLVRVLDLVPDVLPAKASLRTMETIVTNGKKNASTKIKMVVFVLDREIIPKIFENLSNRSEIKNVEISKVSDNTTSFTGDFGHDLTVQFEVSG